MVRLILYLLLAVLLITLLRSFIGIFLRLASQWLLSGPRSSPRGVEMGGELKQDPVCGVYVPASTAIKLNQGGKTLYFCSESCREKYRRGERRTQA
jgi:uncharacterized protein